MLLLPKVVRLRLAIAIAVSVVLSMPVHAQSVEDAINVRCFTGGREAMPRDAYSLPVARASEIQQVLDQHRKVKLDPGADYAKRGGSIKLSSGQELYGIAGSKIAHVVVEDGATGVILQGVTTQGIHFLASRRVTRGNCFSRISGPIIVKDAALEDNLFVDVTRTKLDIDTRGGGYLRNNRFIRVMTHSAYPALRMLGDPKRLSGGNVFLWLNILTPHGDGIVVDGQEDVTFVGLDAESWNWLNLAKKSAMMTVSDTGVLRIIAANGGDAKSSTGRYLDAGADEVQIFGTNIERVGDPAVVIQPQVKRLFTSNTQDLSFMDLAKAFSAKTFTNGKADIVLRGLNHHRATLAAQDVSELREMFIERKASRAAWQRSISDPIPDPAGSKWSEDLDKKPDSTAYLQGLVNSQGIARVPAGVYYISDSIKIRNGQGLIGEGAARTAIIAKRPTLDMIISDEHIVRPAPSTFTLADITLQGGRNGVRHDAAGAGPGAQFNLVFLSHVTFREMSEAGILISGIYGWDNNFIANVNFFRCKEAGIKQRASPLYFRGDGPGMSYMDKNVFYRCQFVESGTGVDLHARRPNNLNAFIDCTFRNNVKSAASMTRNSSTIFANSEFINNGGDPVVISDKPTFFVNSYFHAGKNNVSMLPDQATCEGCVFENGKAANTSIVETQRMLPSLAVRAPRVFLYNSRSIDMSIGKIGSAILMNTLLPKDGSLNQQALSIHNGEVRVLVPGLPDPTGQFLIRRDYGP